MERGNDRLLSNAELLELQRWNTPAVYNGWEQITKSDAAKDGFNIEQCHDFMPQMGPMAGYAVTVVAEPSNVEHRKKNPNAWSQYRRYVGSVPGPKIVVVQDLDKPRVFGSFWGEVNSGIHKALGCIGTITDGAIRDLDEMCTVGFKAIARRLCVGHAYSHPVHWNCEVEVFGRTVKPGDLIHADKHGFLVVGREDQAHLLESTRFMDSNECRTMITAARNSSGMTMEQKLRAIDEACEKFTENKRAKYSDGCR
ncbi:MAG: RraA family protein [Phycisphaerales bacterium]|nr:MAG: RraA family protein [Phycisphaerales bacterium]